jgi:hypothetical protein
VHTRGCWLLWHRQPLWLILWIYCWLANTSHRPISRSVWLKVLPRKSEIWRFSFQHL